MLFTYFIPAPTPFSALGWLWFPPKTEAALQLTLGGRKVARGFGGGHLQ
jgi:hypothetical protein